MQILMKISNPVALFICSNKKCQRDFLWNGLLYKGGYRPKKCPFCKVEFTNKSKANIVRLDY